MADDQTKAHQCSLCKTPEDQVKLIACPEGSYFCAICAQKWADAAMDLIGEDPIQLTDADIDEISLRMLAGESGQPLELDALGMPRGLRISEDSWREIKQHVNEVLARSTPMEPQVCKSYEEANRVKDRHLRELVVPLTLTVGVYSRSREEGDPEQWVIVVGLRREPTDQELQDLPMELEGIPVLYEREGRSQAAKKSV